MGSIRAIVIGLLLPVGAAGCGTSANLRGHDKPGFNRMPPFNYDPAPFGGVSKDIEWASSISIVFVLDLPFSLLGDILTLPWTVGEQKNNPLPQPAPTPGSKS